ncbi:MAG: hypothetical protein M9962_14105 [Oligoflexia bacterium]|nr:hypothetical protein [Oligoflexia bacterium]
MGRLQLLLSLRLRFLSTTSVLVICLAVLSACSKSPLSQWKSANKKAKHLMSLEAKYVALEHEHERLKKDYFKLEKEYASLLAETRSKETATQNFALTGDKEGRSLASIAYEVPDNLDEKNLVSLAFEHMRSERFGEAASVWEKVLAQPEYAASRDAQMMFNAGVSWFNVKNYRKAKENFEAARANASGEEKEKIRKKSELWIRVIESKKEVNNSHHGG